VDVDWWESVYEDAEMVGLGITGFDIGRGNMISGDFAEYGLEVARLIVENHGETTETYLVATDFLNEWKAAKKKAIEDGEDSDCVEDGDFDEAEEIESEFKRALMEEYLSILRNDYEYLTSEESIIETIQANEYEFTADGKLA